MSGNKQGDPMLKDSDWDLVSVLSGIVVGAVLLGAVWLVVAALTGGSSSGASTDAATDTGAPPGDAPTGTPAATAGPSSASQPVGSTSLQRCQAAAAAIERPVQLAQPALDQWAVHIGAMNKLVTGAITLPQATAFWNQTRVGAYHRIGRFEAGDRQFERQGADCPRPRLLGSDATPELRACARRVVAELHELDSASTAITTWHHHMHAMDQLRTGKLSPTAATQMWLTMWQRGVHELEDFRADAHVAQQVEGCDGTADTAQPSAAPTGQSQPSPLSPATPSSWTESPMPGMPTH
jgi:hypothetical protein